MGLSGLWDLATSAAARSVSPGCYIAQRCQVLDRVSGSDADSARPEGDEFCAALGLRRTAMSRREPRAPALDSDLLSAACADVPPSCPFANV